jgi:hypothetical protein
VVFGWLGLPLEITFGSRYELIARVVGFIPAVSVAGHSSEVTWSVLLPHLSALSALSGSFDGGLSGHGPAITGGRFCIT